MDARLIEVGIVMLSVAGWFGVYGLALLVTRPFLVRAAPATQDLSAEPPALASLVVNGWDLTEDAAEATLLDLGARRYLEFRQPAADPMQTTVHILDPNPPGLTAYERRVFDRVCGLAKGGVVPLTALTFRDDAQAASWWKRLRAEIVADARARGISRRRFGPAVIGVLTATAALAAVGIAVAVFHYAQRTHDDDVFGITFSAGFFGFVALAGLGGRSVGERDTPAGREVAGRWLGVRDWLRGHEAFADLPPSAVTVWDRYLAYGAAVGATRVSSAVIDMGMGDRKRVWSCFGGTWHRVRVRYPRGWKRYGQKAHKPIIRAVIAGAIGILLLKKWAGVISGVSNVDQVPDSVNGGLDVVTRVGILLGVVLLCYSLYVLARMIIDMATPVQLTGEVLWVHVWRSTNGSENSPAQPWLHYLAVDDGKGDKTTAWGLPSELAHTCDPGDTVTIKVRRWTRRVLTVHLDERGAAGRLSVPDASSEQTETLIADAMGVPRPRSGSATAALVAGVALPGEPLVTNDEVSQAFGIGVRSKGHPTTPFVPMQMTEYEANDGQDVLLINVASGLAATMAVRARRRGTPLPGIADEAFAGDGWAVARRGDIVIMMQLRGRARSSDPRGLHWLLSVAAQRLPA